jgi:hypothetical protein
MKQLDLFEWASQRPSAVIIDVMPALIRKAAREAYLPQPIRAASEVVPIDSIRRGAA